MKNYKIKFVSLTNSIFLIIILLISYFGGILLFLPHGQNEYIPIMITIFSLIIAYFLWQRFVIAWTQWTIDKSGISMIWIKQFSFANKNKIVLKWEEIESIERGFDPKYYYLKIKLVSGKKLKFYHDQLTTKDDFNGFIRILNQTFIEQKIQSPKTMA